MEKVVSCYLPAQLLQCSPLQALCGLLGLHSLPSAQAWKSTLDQHSSHEQQFHTDQVLLLLFSIWATAHGLVHLRIPCQLLTWFCLRWAAAPKRVTATTVQHALFICWNRFCKNEYREKTKNPCSRMLERKIVPSTNMMARKFFSFFPPFSHQHLHIGNSPYNRMLARLTQATSILKLPFILFAWQ